jgi:predicted AAA+ superfamily ATPase
MVQRKKYDAISKHISKKEFTILIGARQIGKSTLLKQLYNELNEKNNTSYFLNLDRKNILDELNQNPENIFKLCPLIPNKRIIVFIDEIQYLVFQCDLCKYKKDCENNKVKISENIE